tara:strand:+ start:60 stop:272 length:213 start_codon:yes stop_codon:yes gene_type:complete
MIKSSKKHLEEAKETYFQHMGNALKISFNLMLGSLMAAIHSLIPAFFKTGASSKIENLHAFIHERSKENK